MRRRHPGAVVLVALLMVSSAAPAHSAEGRIAIAGSFSEVVFLRGAAEHELTFDLASFWVVVGTGGAFAEERDGSQAHAGVADSPQALLLWCTATCQVRWLDVLKFDVGPGGEGRVEALDTRLGAVRVEWVMNRPNNPILSGCASDALVGGSWHVDWRVRLFSPQNSAWMVDLHGGSLGQYIVRPLMLCPSHSALDAAGYVDIAWES